MKQPKTSKEKIQLALEWKKRGLRVVFTNGCFDLLHLGHITYLQKARELGDKLIIGINTDSSIKKLKGNNRPIYKLTERMEILSSLRMVDLVIPFGETTPLKLIKKIKPSILVKGGDWAIDNIVGKDFVLSYGGKVLSIPLIIGYSTSNIIRKIKKVRV